MDDMTERLMIQAIGELKESNKTLASNTTAIKDNLKILNDQNILHDTKMTGKVADMIEQLKTMTTKYWGLIISLIGIIIAILGAKDLVTGLL